LFSRKHQEDQFSNFEDDALILATPREEDFVTIVAGDGSKSSAYCPGFALTCSVTKKIKESL